MLEVNNFFHGTRIVEGYGVLNETGNEVKTLGFKKVLIVTDDFLSKSAHYQVLKESLEKEGIEYLLETNVKPNPRAEDCDAMAKIAIEEKVDAIIALGGGSAMDQAKAVAAIVTNGKTTVEWGDVELEHSILPLICIPSTAGTGSEVTWCAVITDTARMYKMTVGDPIHMIPTLAICDPTITLDLPQSLTASCGVDALTHCIEAYTVKVHQPITDALALKGISLIAQNLEKAYEKGHDKDARRNMMIASTIGGMSFISSNVGAVHAFAETVGAWFDTPHGVANSLFLPYIMEYNIPACMDRFIDIAQALGIERNGMNDQEYAYSAVQYVKDLNRRLNIPTIKEIKGITEDKFDAIAQRSADNILSNDNAREIHKEDYLELLKKLIKMKEKKKMHKIKKIVDLSWEFTADTPIYPGDPEPSVTVATTLENEGYNLSTLVMGTQTGSHVDAPYHFSNEGATIDQMELDFFLGDAIVVRVTDKKDEEAITMEDIEPYKEQITPGKIVLFNTNWYKKRGTEEFFHHPYVNGEVAHYLVEQGVRFIGIDTINADQTGGTEFPVHDLFSEKRLMIGENWAYFDRIDFENPYVIAIPMKVVGCDGSPVRAIAVEWED